MVAMLKNKQINALFFSGLAVLFTGMGLFPILPLYAAQFDASNSMIGFYFAAIYAANSLGPVITGWLSPRFSMRKLFITSAGVGMPALVLLGQAQTFPQVILLTALLWFSGGMVMALISILTGMAVDEGSRGKAFSLMAMVAPAGALAGGAVVGPLIAWQGYPVMFAALAVVWSAIPLIGLLRLKDDVRVITRVSGSRAAAEARLEAAPPASRLSAGFVRVVAFTFLGAMAVNISRLGTSLAMQEMNFSAESVSSAGMVSGLAAIPFTLAIGVLSDRLGRKHFMFISYLFAVSGALILFNAASLWQFWLASVLLMLAFTISGAMAQALTGDLLPAEAMSRGLSWLNALMAAASIVCFAVGGILFDLLGLPVVFLMAALLALFAGVAIETMAHSHSEQAVEIVADCSEA